MKVGDKSGLWTVIFTSDTLMTETKYPAKAVLCQCVCGKTQLIREREFRVQRSKGCRSCLNSARATRDSTMLEVFHKYQRSAVTRGVDFDLTADEFMALTQLDCFYCGQAPNNRAPRKNDFYYSGVDRKDNRQGYNALNAVACCGTCNRGKNNMDYDEWITYLDNLTAYRSRRA